MNPWHLILLFCLCSFAQESTIIHIDTWPSNAEVSLSVPPDASNLQPLHTPAQQEIVMDSNTMRVYFFKPGFHEATLTVRLKPSPTNYLFFHLQPETDSLLIEKQNDFLQKRSGKIWAKRTWISASIPAGLALFFLSQAAYSYHLASQEKKNATQSIFTNDAPYASFVNQFHQHVHDGNNAKKRAVIASGITGLFFVAGFVIYF